MQIHERLKLARKTRGLRQVDLADLMSVGVNTVIRWESGTGVIPKTKLKGLEEVLGVPSRFFLEVDLTQHDLEVMLEGNEPIGPFNALRGGRQPEGNAGLGWHRGIKAPESWWQLSKRTEVEEGRWNLAPVMEVQDLLTRSIDSKAASEVGSKGVPHVYPGRVVAHVTKNTDLHPLIIGGDILLIQLDWECSDCCTEISSPWGLMPFAVNMDGKLRLLVVREPLGKPIGFRLSPLPEQFKLEKTMLIGPVVGLEREFISVYANLEIGGYLNDVLMTLLMAGPEPDAE